MVNAIKEFQEEELGYIDDHIEPMIDMAQHSQAVALELTKIVLEHGNKKDLSEEKIFGIFEKATDTIMNSFDRAMATKNN